MTSPLAALDEVLNGTDDLSGEDLDLEGTGAPGGGEGEGEEDLGETDEAIAEGEGEGEGEGDEEEDEEEGAAAGEKDDEEVDWTPEKIAEERQSIEAQRAELLERQARLEKHWGTTEKRADKLKQSVEKHRANVLSFEAREAAFDADIRALASGDADQALAALGRRMKMDPTSAYRALSMSVMGQKPQAEESQELRALRDELKSIKESLEQQGTQRKEADEAATVARGEAAIAHIATSGDYPHCAIESGSDNTALSIAVARAMHSMVQNGQQPTYEGGLALVERELRERYESHQRALAGKSGAAGSGPDAGRETSAQAKPGSVRRSPARTVSSGLSSEGGGKARLETDEERMAAAVNLLPDGLFR